MAEDTPLEYQQILLEWTRPTFEWLPITDITETKPNAFVLCIPPMHQRNKRKHPLQFLCQTKERKLTPLDRQVCIHNNWWTEIIWNKDKECYYTNGLLKKLHDYDETDSKEESQDSETEEPTIDQQIRQAPINPTLKNSPLVATTSLPSDTMTTTMTTEETTATTTSGFGTIPTQLQRIASAMQKAFQHRKKPETPGGGPPGGGGGPSGGGGGPPGGGGGPPGGGQPPANQQPVPPTPDVKAMGSLPQIFNGDRSKADDFIKEVKGYFCLNTNVPGYNSPYKKVAFTLTLIKGDEPAQWVWNMGNWLDTLNPVADNIEDLWLQFLEAYAYQFQDSQAAQRAWNELKTCRMMNNNYDEYVSKFEVLADKAEYTRGSAEVYDMFLEGLPTNILYDVLKPLTLTTYNALKDKVWSLAQGKAIIDGLLHQWNIGTQGGGNAYQRVNNNNQQHPPPQNNWRGSFRGQRGGNWQQYNSTMAPPSMNNIPVPMDLSRSCAPTNWHGQGNQRGWCQGGYQGRVAQGSGNLNNACFNCGQTGHYARNCPQRWGQNTQSNLIDLDYEEQLEFPKNKVADLRSQINIMTPDEKDQLIKELGEEEDFPTAWLDWP